MRNFIVLCLLACLASCTDKKEFQTIRERIDLSGNWNSSLGNCTLPGTTDENKLGDGRHPTNVTSQLTRTYPYSGIVEYEKDVEIPVQMEGKRLILFMERTKPVSYTHLEVYKRQLVRCFSKIGSSSDSITQICTKTFGLLPQVFH